MYKLTPKEEVSARLAGLRAGIARAGMDGCLIVQNADLFYFTGCIQQGILAVPADGEPVYFVRKVYERAVAESPVEIIVKIASPKEIPAWLEKKGISFRKLGLELDVMPVSVFHRYAGLFPGAGTEDVSPVVRELRSVKSRSEIETMRGCGKKISSLLSGARKEIRAGMTESELQGILQGRAIAGGHTTIARMRSWNQEVGLGCIISGPDAAVPSYADFPTAGKGTSPFVPAGQGYRAFGKNEPIIVDTMWAQDGYLVDMARTYAIGPLSEKMSMAHDFSVKIMRNIESATRPGAVAGDLYEIGMEMASRSPFAAHFMGPPGYNVKFIGHGIGIEADEFPFIAKGAGTVLKSGMTFALEPKFVFPGEGAVGLENVYLVTDTGFEKLTQMDEGIIDCGEAGAERPAGEEKGEMR